MAAYRYSESLTNEKAQPPACSEECIWYEPQETNLTCSNRNENICSLHRTEIFEKNKAAN